MTRTEVANLVEEELTRALGKHAGLLGLRESDSPLAKKLRLQESGAARESREEREYKTAKRARKEAERQFERTVEHFKSIGMSEAGAVAAAKGRSHQSRFTG